ncbi:MAG: hypothetical protein NTX29_05230 [Actinobacteria bacterium]|nr:hypothetical protein [Actinomycetota bacterium]
MTLRERVERQLYVGGMVLQRATPADLLRSTLDMLRPKSGVTSLRRVGGQGDGGYLIPDDLEGIRLLLSPGVAESRTFEDELFSSDGIPAVLCDRLDVEPDCQFPIDKLWLGPYSTHEQLSLNDWVDRHAPDDGSDLMLQMDIEGAEYLTLLACPAKMDDIFVPVHIHANNADKVDRRSGVDIPVTMEVTYHRRDRFRPSGKPVLLPHELDAPNVLGKPEIRLSDFWTS